MPRRPAPDGRSWAEPVSQSNMESVLRGASAAAWNDRVRRIGDGLRLPPGRGDAIQELDELASVLARALGRRLAARAMHMFRTVSLPELLPPVLAASGGKHWYTMTACGCPSGIGICTGPQCGEMWSIWAAWAATSDYGQGCHLGELMALENEPPAVCKDIETLQAKAPELMAWAAQQSVFAQMLMALIINFLWQFLESFLSEHYPGQTVDEVCNVTGPASWADFAKKVKYATQSIGGLYYYPMESACAALAMLKWAWTKGLVECMSMPSQPDPEDPDKVKVTLYSTASGGSWTSLPSGITYPAWIVDGSGPIKVLNPNVVCVGQYYNKNSNPLALWVKLKDEATGSAAVGLMKEAIEDAAHWTDGTILKFKVSTEDGDVHAGSLRQWLHLTESYFSVPLLPFGPSA